MLRERYSGPLGGEDDGTKLRDYLGMHIGTINMLLLRQGLEMLDIAAEQTDKNPADLKNNIEGSSRELGKCGEMCRLKL